MPRAAPWLSEPPCPGRFCLWAVGCPCPLAGGREGKNVRAPQSQADLGDKTSFSPSPTPGCCCWSLCGNECTLRCLIHLLLKPRWRAAAVGRSGSAAAPVRLRHPSTRLAFSPQPQMLQSHHITQTKIKRFLLPKVFSLPFFLLLTL